MEHDSNRTSPTVRWVHESSEGQTGTCNVELKKDGRFVAAVPEIPGVISDGAAVDEAVDEALDNVREAAEAVLESPGQRRAFALISPGSSK